MSRTTKPETEATEEVKTEIVEEVKEEVKNVEEPVKENVTEAMVKPVAAVNMENTVVKPVNPVDPIGPVGKLSAETQRMNAQQFFDTYPHDNKQVVALIITLYGNQIKTVAQWEAFYQQMLKKRVS